MKNLKKYKIHRNSVTLIFLLFLFLSACIKPYTPKIESNEASKMVVSGRITNQIGFQAIKISKSIPLDESHYIPVSNCKGSIWDENGKEFPLVETDPGVYQFEVKDGDIQIGLSYAIQIITPDGEELRSEPDTMTTVAPIETPNYVIDSIYNGAYNYFTPGLQFQIDINGNENTSPYYLFEIDATYEHHAKFAREWYYDYIDEWHYRAGVFHIYPPDSSLFYCWTTQRVPEIFTLSTENLAENKFTNFPLQFVPFNRPYLTYGYSMMVRQIGLSRKAYEYWENMRLNNNQNGELYAKQPVDTQGNIKNLTNPEKEVLGYFGASIISEMRIFIDPMPTNPNPFCGPVKLEQGFREIGKENYPAFLMNNPLGDYLMTWLPDPCVNCASYSGSTTKPDFWPY
ncbi:MAG: DUF4249 domain-containing protein [Bacteroidales bacterium]|nr:DUF4249 domain-containing protein [Bacteroidales bacterium]